MTTGYWASLYRWGIDGKRIEELVVTETSLPDRMGWKTDSNGSALCRIDCTWAETQQLHLPHMRKTVSCLWKISRNQAWRFLTRKGM